MSDDYTSEHTISNITCIVCSPSDPTMGGQRMDARADDIKVCDRFFSRKRQLSLSQETALSTPFCSSYLRVAYDVSFNDGGQLFLVVRTVEPLLSFSRQGVEGLVRGPKHGKRFVDGQSEDRE